MQKIPLLDLTAQYRSIQPEIDAAIQRVITSGRFILGEEVEALEQEIAAYIGVKYGIGVASGTDALILALRALEIGPGDEVIIPAYTFFATAGAVLHVGATPRMIDINPKTYCIDVSQIAQAIGPSTKAIIPVHLYGHPADMGSIMALAEQYGLYVIEDNAQAFGASYQGQRTGSLGHIACLSFFPSKNLGSYGDGGMVVTNDPILAEKVHMLRTHGWKKRYYPEVLGYNSRLDALQAAILRAKLPHVGGWNRRRRELAKCYTEALANISVLTLPYEELGTDHVYHLYVLRCPERADVQQRLRQNGIDSAIYYPQPLHLTEPCKILRYQPGDFPIAERASQETLAIPLYPEMSEEQIAIVVEHLVAHS